jgi:integrase
MGRPVQQVDVFTVQDRRRDGKARPWVVRWRVDGRQRTRSFRTRVEADRHRSLLTHAVTMGDRFDPATGEPVAWSQPAADLPVHRWAQAWVAEQWPEWQPRTRRSALEALTRFLPLVVREGASKPPATLRTFLPALLDPEQSVDESDEAARWLDRHALLLVELTKPLLAEVELRLGVGYDGTPLAASTAGRRRKIAKACVRRAVQLDLLAADPWPPAPSGRSLRKVNRKRQRVDGNELPDPATMVRILDAMATHQPGSRTFQQMTAIVYYAGLRPSEVLMLRRRSLTLPKGGSWGRIDVTEADIDFDTPGEPKTGPRSVPIPPVLVAQLKTWLAAHDFAPDDLLFRTRSGTRPTTSNWGRAWHRALDEVGAPSWRIYDCRHAAATTWLAAGAPLGEVARRLGHTVDTLVSTYVGALTGDQEITNTRIQDALEPAAADTATRGLRAVG